MPRQNARPKLPDKAPGVPSYRLHRASGKAVATFNGRDHYLGEHGTPESVERYHALVARWLTGGKRLDSVTPDAPLSVAELILRYVEHTARHFATRRTCETIVANVKAALAPLRELYGMEPATAIRAKTLKVVRDRFVQQRLARGTVNARVGVIKRLVRWGVVEELLPAECWHSVSALEGLRRGESEAHESEPVEPVADEVVEATLPHCSRVVAAMIQTQRLTGMRPAEVCLLRGVDLDRSSDVWRYVPAVHKTELKGKRRVVSIGPRAQAIIAPFLRPSYLFDPNESVQDRRDVRHAARVTPLSCGNKPGSNRRQNPKRHPGDRFTTPSYRRAIERACRRAFPLPDELRRMKGEPVETWRARLGERWPEVARWHAEHVWRPNQLRHTHATEVRGKYGLDHAQATLGHSRADVTQVYAAANARLADEVARAIG